MANGNTFAAEGVNGKSAEASDVRQSLWDVREAIVSLQEEIDFLVVEIWNPQQKHVISPLYREKFCFSPFTRWPITTSGSRPAVCQHPAPSVGVSLCSKHLSWSCTCLGWVLRSAPIHWVLEYSGAVPGSWRLGARAQTGGPPQVLATSKQSIESVNLGCQSQVLANQLWMVSQFFSKPEKRHIWDQPSS